MTKAKNIGSHKKVRLKQVKLRRKTLEKQQTTPVAMPADTTITCKQLKSQKRLQETARGIKLNSPQEKRPIRRRSDATSASRHGAKSFAKPGASAAPRRARCFAAELPVRENKQKTTFLKKLYLKPDKTVSS